MKHREGIRRQHLLVNAHLLHSLQPLVDLHEDSATIFHGFHLVLTDSKKRHALMVLCEFRTEFSSLAKPSFEYDVGVEIDNLAHDLDIHKVFGFFLAIGSVNGLTGCDEMRLINASTIPAP